MTRLKKLVLLFVVLFNGLFANADVPWGDFDPPGSWQYAIEGERSGIDDLHYTIYDAYGNWDCDRKFLFLTYTNSLVTLKFYNVGTTADHHDIYVRNKTQNPNTLTWTQVILNHADSDPLEVSYPDKGTYEFFYYDLGVVPGVGSALLKAEVMMIPQLQKIWAEMEPFCATGSYPDGKYHFKIKTIPSIKDIMYQESVRYYNATPNSSYENCEQFAPFKITLTGTMNSVSLVRPVGTNSVFQSPNYPFKFEAPWWNLSAYETDIEPTIEDYYINVTDLDFSDLTLLEGTNFMNLNLEYNDGITTVPLQAPFLMIHEPVSSYFTGPGHTYNQGQGFADLAYHYLDYTVTGTEIWKPNSNPIIPKYGGGIIDEIYIERNLIIEPGARLELRNMKLHFGPNGKVIIKNGIQGSQYGGYMYMYQSTLTTIEGCGDPYKWQGVEVWGLPTNSQAGGYATTYQGYLNMESSTINNAKVGVLAGKAGNTQNGGIVRAWYSYFNDNTVSIKFPTYYYPSINASYIYPNASVVQACTFTRNAGGTNEIVYGIQMVGISNLNVQASKFYSYSHNNTHGILGFDSGVKAIGNKFFDMKYGIYMLGVNTSAMATYVTGNTFTNNNIGIITAGLTAPQIVNSTFNVPGPTSLQTVAGYTGILLSKCNGYIVKNNTIQTITGQPGIYNTGILVENSGPFNNYIRENTINRLGVGLLSNFMNTNTATGNTGKGLQAYCNTITNCRRSIAARGTSTTQHGMRVWQGSYGTAADNTLPSALGAVTLFNAPGEVNSMTYFWKPGTDKYPNTIYGNITRIQTTVAASSCSSSLPPIIIGPPSGSNPPSYEFLFSLMQDEDGGTNRADLAGYASQLGDEYGDLMTVDFTLEDGQTTKAEALYSSITSNYTMPQEASDEIDRWGKDLLNIRLTMMKAGLTPEQVDPSNAAKLEEIAIYGSMWAKSRAQAWLSMYDGREFEIAMLYPDTTITVDPDSTGYNDTTEMGQVQGRYANEQSNPSLEVIKKNGENHLYPNPVHNILNIMYTGGSATLVLTDVVGRTVLNTEIKEGENKLNVQDLPIGIYLYRVQQNGHDVMRGKISKD